MAVDIANASVADGHQVTMCVTRDTTTLASELDSRIELLVLARRSRLAVRESLRFARWVRRNRVDVMHVHMRHVLAYVLAVHVAFGLRTPIVFHDHYGTIEIDSSVPAWFRVASRLLGHYVGVYERLTEWAITAGVPRRRATTIENAIELQRITTAHPHNLRRELNLSDVPLGVLVATLRRDKGVEVLIEAIAHVRHPVHIAIAGAEIDAPYAAECRRLIRERGVGDRISLLGGRTDVPRLLQGADFAVLSSHTESGPLVLIEYLAAGLPVVATRVGDIGRRLDALGVPGFVPPSQPVALATAIDELLSAPSARLEQRISVGQRALDAGWTIKAVMPRWYAVYQSVTR